MKSLKLVVLLIVIQLTCLSSAFWWLFTSRQDESGEQPGTSLQSVFAPFEVTEVETKFLAEATHYLGNLPKLDQCNLLIINRLRSSCNKMTEVDVSKLSVNLLNCQSAVEGRKVFKCTDDMTLSACTKGMDPDTWNAYHVVSNRARAVCYSVRQTEFRIKTEMTINNLAHSAKDNLASLKTLLEGQEDLSNKTSETMTQIIDGNEKVVKVQTELNDQQKTLKEAITDNIESLSLEKTMISTRQSIIMKHSREVKNDLVSLASEIKRHHVARKSQDKDLLAHVEAIQHKARDVLDKLDLAVKSMDDHYDRIETRHEKIIENVQDIQKAINFITEAIVSFEETFHSQMKWINDTVGGTRDKLSVISVLLGHVVHFLILIFAMIFTGSPVLSRATILVLLPMNCVFALRNKRHFTHKEMAMIVAATFPVNWICCVLKRAWKNHAQCLIDFRKAVNLLGNCFSKLSRRFLSWKRDNQSRNRASFSHEDKEDCEDLDLTSVQENCEDLITSTPDKPYKRQLYQSGEASFGNESFGSSTPRRCGSLTRTGQRCKSYCRRGSTSCSRHENSYNSYFEQSNVN